MIQPSFSVRLRAGFYSLLAIVVRLHFYRAAEIRPRALLLLLALAVAAGFSGCSRTVPVTASEGATPKAGERGPGFTLPTATGGTVSLDNFKGQTGVILVFYRGYW